MMPLPKIHYDPWFHEDMTDFHLPEIGDENLVSELLAGKQELNLTMIKLLGSRFGVSPKTFLTE